jgi:outer membrane protein assembly factor BamB
MAVKGGKDSSDTIAWSKTTGGVYLPSPILYGNELYLLNNNGVMAAYDAKTGTRTYEQRVGAGGSFVASPVAAAGRLYVTSEDGDVYVVKAGAKYELLAQNEVGEPVLATPALAGNLLIVRGAKHVFAIGETAK